MSFKADDQSQMAQISFSTPRKVTELHILFLRRKDVGNIEWTYTRGLSLTYCVTESFHSRRESRNLGGGGGVWALR